MTHWNKKKIPIQIKLHFLDICFTKNDYFLKNSRYTIFQKDKKHNRIKSLRNIKDSKDLIRIPIEETMEMKSTLYQDKSSSNSSNSSIDKKTREYLPKSRKIVIRQISKLNGDTVYRDIGYIEIALDQLATLAPKNKDFEFELIDKEMLAEGSIRVNIEWDFCDKSDASNLTKSSNKASVTSTTCTPFSLAFCSSRDAADRVEDPKAHTEFFQELRGKFSVDENDPIVTITPTPSSDNQKPLNLVPFGLTKNHSTRSDYGIFDPELTQTLDEITNISADQRDAINNFSNTLDSHEASKEGHLTPDITRKLSKGSRKYSPSIKWVEPTSASAAALTSDCTSNSSDSAVDKDKTVASGTSGPVASILKSTSCYGENAHRSTKSKRSKKDKVLSSTTSYDMEYIDPETLTARKKSRAIARKLSNKFTESSEAITAPLVLPLASKMSKRHVIATDPKKNASLSSKSFPASKILLLGSDDEGDKEGHNHPETDEIDNDSSDDSEVDTDAGSDSSDNERGSIRIKEMPRAVSTASLAKSVSKDSVRSAPSTEIDMSLNTLIQSDKRISKKLSKIYSSPSQSSINLATSNSNSPNNKYTPFARLDREASTSHEAMSNTSVSYSTSKSFDHSPFNNRRSANHPISFGTEHPFDERSERSINLVDEFYQDLESATSASASGRSAANGSNAHRASVNSLIRRVLSKYDNTQSGSPTQDIDLHVSSSSNTRRSLASLEYSNTGMSFHSGSQNSHNLSQSKTNSINMRHRLSIPDMDQLSAEELTIISELSWQRADFHHHHPYPHPTTDDIPADCHIRSNKSNRHVTHRVLPNADPLVHRQLSQIAHPSAQGNTHARVEYDAVYKEEEEIQSHSNHFPPDAASVGSGNHLSLSSHGMEQSVRNDTMSGTVRSKIQHFNSQASASRNNSLRLQSSQSQYQPQKVSHSSQSFRQLNQPQSQPILLNRSYQ
jgi:hypothetical protein